MRFMMAVSRLIESFRGTRGAVAVALAASVVAGHSASVKQVAEQFQAGKHFDLDGSMVDFNLPAGIDARIVGSTFEQVVGVDGKIRRPLSDVTTLVTFELNQDGADKQLVTRELLIPGRMKVAAGSNPKPAVVPALQEWVGMTGCFTPTADSRIVIRSGDGAKGEPSLRERMEVFASDLKEVGGFELEVVEADAAKAGDIFVTLEPKGEVVAL